MEEEGCSSWSGAAGHSRCWTQRRHAGVRLRWRLGWAWTLCAFEELGVMA